MVMLKFLINKDEILRVNDSKTVEVEVPEWGGKVLIGAVSGENRERWEKEVKKDPQPHNIRALLVCFSVVDQQGKLVFTEKDIELLNKKNWKALDRIYDAAIAYNLIGEKNIVAEAKN